VITNSDNSSILPALSRINFTKPPIPSLTITKCPPKALKPKLKRPDRHLPLIHQLGSVSPPPLSLEPRNSTRRSSVGSSWRFKEDMRLISLLYLPFLERRL
jgi:hypothetical protein